MNIRNPPVPTQSFSRHLPNISMSFFFPSFLPSCPHPRARCRECLLSPIFQQMHLKVAKRTGDVSHRQGQSERIGLVVTLSILEYSVQGVRGCRYSTLRMCCTPHYFDYPDVPVPGTSHHPDVYEAALTAMLIGCVRACVRACLASRSDVTPTVAGFDSGRTYDLGVFLRARGVRLCSSSRAGVKASAVRNTTHTHKPGVSVSRARLVVCAIVCVAYPQCMRCCGVVLL